MLTPVNSRRRAYQLQSISTYLVLRNFPIVVCNLVTGEFVTLPDLRDLDYRGLGLDPNTGRYKVVMLYSRHIIDRVFKVPVHVLGTDSWRGADRMLGLGLRNLRLPVLFNGAIHWLVIEKDEHRFGVVSFDLDLERLHYRSLLAPSVDRMFITHIGMAVLGGRLWMYTSFRDGKLYMCMVDEHAVSDSSPEWISHHLSKAAFHLHPICSHDDGALLMLHGDNELVYCDPRQFSPRIKPLRFAKRGRVQVFAYTASFVSLKDIVRPGNAEVLNVSKEPQLVTRQLTC